MLDIGQLAPDGCHDDPVRRRSFVNRNTVIYIVLISMIASVASHLVYAFSYVLHHVG